MKLTFLELIQLILFTLKITGYLTCSWFIILLPTLIPLGILGIMLILYFSIIWFFEL